MKGFNKRLVVLFLSIFFLGIFLAYGSGQREVTIDTEPLLAKVEKSKLKFMKIRIGKYLVYYRQDMVGKAVVEKSFKVYHFDSNTNMLIKKIDNIRQDISRKIKRLIPQKKAATLVKDEIIFMRLVLISRVSDVYRFRPIPENVCYVFMCKSDERFPYLVVIDAVTGEFVGYGTAPPYTPPKKGFALSGPEKKDPCGGSWAAWVDNAEEWFEKFGYSTTKETRPAKSVIETHVKDSNTKLIYQFGHGGSEYFANGCDGTNKYEFVYASDIKTWMAAANKKNFVFLGHCEGMCNTGNDTFSYEYRKGSNTDTTTVGYCNMSKVYGTTCWENSKDWQNKMFDYINEGYTVKKAFDKSVADYPMCKDCVKFAGDANFTIK
jgi:hypothetical protein